MVCPICKKHPRLQYDTQTRLHHARTSTEYPERVCAFDPDDELAQPSARADFSRASHCGSISLLRDLCGAPEGTFRTRSFFLNDQNMGFVKLPTTGGASRDEMIILGWYKSRPATRWAQVIDYGTGATRDLVLDDMRRLAAHYLTTELGDARSGNSPIRGVTLGRFNFIADACHIDTEDMDDEDREAAVDCINALLLLSHIPLADVTADMTAIEEATHRALMQSGPRTLGSVSEAVNTAINAFRNALKGSSLSLERAHRAESQLAEMLRTAEQAAILQGEEPAFKVTGMVIEGDVLIVDMEVKPVHPIVVGFPLDEERRQLSDAEMQAVHDKAVALSGNGTHRVALISPRIELADAVEPADLAKSVEDRPPAHFNDGGAGNDNTPNNVEGDQTLPPDYKRGDEWGENPLDVKAWANAGDTIDTKGKPLTQEGLKEAFDIPETEAPKGRVFAGARAKISIDGVPIAISTGPWKPSSRFEKTDCDQCDGSGFMPANAHGVSFPCRKCRPIGVMG